ncbi:glycosyltransferase family 4 protein [Fimbriimonas ginsengisoli]|uniref:Glycosyl transferase, group 1 n=1 Tax=Fimbriimonas ginsengisoli Gsoil 348 TaxID=661478 RepID=A0A068NSG7_FIMGI|nr:glycosyltransferase family 1 protein [Fimbriimonas ginsengisoli]AIE86386.1 glycosyl transferase, group 1 [Fimbriimonas ginsengisoli Gsoil 348]
MRIAIDARHLSDFHTSNRTYWRELVVAMASEINGDELLLVTDRPIASGVLPPGLPVREVVVKAPSSRLWSLFHFPRACRRLGADLAHMQYTVSPLFRIPTATTIHDVSFFIDPSWFGMKDRVLLQASVPASARRAGVVITVSETCRQESIRYLHVPAEKVVSTPLGMPSYIAPVDREAAIAHVRGRLGFDSPFVLAVGVLQPRKNWRLVMRSVAMARQLGSDLQLVIVGRTRDDGEEIDREIESLNGRDWIHLAGGVPDEEISYYYSAAEALIHPSYHEGFGLTPLEAFGCGLPVIASDRGAIPEVTGDAAILLPPTEPEPWARAIIEVTTTDRGTELRSEGRVRASRFTWASTARKTRDAYRLALQ